MDKKTSNLLNWREKQENYFEERSEVYREWYGESSPFHLEISKQFINFAGVTSRMSILETGCGFGRLTIPLLETGAKVTGLDIVDGSFEFLRSKVDKLGLGQNFATLKSSMEMLPGNGEYDLIIGRGVLHHIDDPAVAFASIFEALKPGGRVAFLDPNPFQLAWLALVLLHPNLSFEMEKNLWRGTPGTIKKIFNEQNFINFNSKFAGFLPPLIADKFPSSKILEKIPAALPLVKTQGLYLLVKADKPVN
jgi:2-polyprenyl-3-methyl-5-hydroxy-6-metoxy-1,4-benzoquinol methylase